MANLLLFKSYPGKQLPPANACNEPGAAAYSFSAKHRLAQYAATGCLNTTFYANAEVQLQTLLEACQALEPRFIAKTAIYCREHGYMKDTPALLTAVLTMSGQEYVPQVFKRVIGNGKMLRNFVQIMRSGVVGRKSLGTKPKKLIQNWLNTASETELLNAYIGTQPSLADVIKMVHPKPLETWREAFFAWVIGKPYTFADLPPITQAYLQYRFAHTLPVPAVPFQMLTMLPLTREQWTAIALNASWQMLRMNLNTFARHGVFTDSQVVNILADKLRDKSAIANARVFPYQLLAAYKASAGNLPGKLSDALQDALEIALSNVPEITGCVVVCPDVSGSMASPVTGGRKSATTAVRCIDVAALVAAALLRKNPDSVVLPFESDVVNVNLNTRDTVMTNAQKLAAIGGGGTNCSAPQNWLNRHQTAADLVVFISDNQSWQDAKRNGATEMMQAWATFKQRNPKAKLVCVDIQPYVTTQAAEQADILNVGGFSDTVFKIIAAFAVGQLQPEHWVGIIEETVLSGN
ncbi:MAG: RNA-binding protein [Methylobacter sp.]|nr:MAG: RNA-binding protein [Methylobacter sp.]PPD02605.1 MAG: RNA-binding protein [Methylobacter sp.]